MEFNEYIDIKNAYQHKFILGKLNRHPELKDCKYIVQQKLDGANFSVHITQDSVKYARRTSFIEDNGVSFNGHLGIVNQPEFVKFIDELQKLGYDKIIIYGEIFGEGIQKRLDYGKGKKILFYDMVIDDNYITQESFLYIMDSIDYSHYVVPIIGIYDTLNEALSIPNVYYNEFGDIDNVEASICEGNVIKPYSENAHRFYIKNKNDLFADKMKTKKKKVKLVEGAPEHVQKLMDEFNSYITENRVLDMFSKEGEIETCDQIGKYIKLIMQDAIKDYLKDNAEEHNILEDHWQKRIFGIANKQIVTILKKYL